MIHRVACSQLCHAVSKLSLLLRGEPSEIPTRLIKRHIAKMKGYPANENYKSIPGRLQLWPSPLPKIRTVKMPTIAERGAGAWELQ